MQTHWHEPDIEAVRIQLACFAGQYLTDYPPAWCMAIAPSGSAKTVILEALNGIENFHAVDQLTPTTFISGKFDEDGGNPRVRERNRAKAKAQAAAAKIGAVKNNKRPESASFLQRIGDSATIAISDFSTILSMHADVRNNLFSQMRRIYDGNFRREFGTAENLDDREWKGRITMLVAVTPEVDRYNQMFSTLGDRFIRVRWPRAAGHAAMAASAKQNHGVKEELRTLVHDFVNSFLQSKKSCPVIPAPALHRIGELTELMCFARTYVHRKGNDIDGEPSPESNTRLPQQLCQMARGWHALMEDAEVGAEGMRLIWRAAWDCLPPARRAVLDSLRNKKSVYSPGSNYFTNSSIQFATEDLIVLGLVTEPTLGIAKSTLTPFAAETLARAGNDIISFCDDGF